VTRAYSFEHKEQCSFPALRAAVGDCDLSVLHVARGRWGEWQWLVRRDGRDIAEGAAPALADAQRQAEAVALTVSVRAEAYP
jgi:hypothetical protein